MAREENRAIFGEGSEDVALAAAAPSSKAAPSALEVRSEASLFGTTMNMATNVVGAGLLSLPWCLKEASLVPGLVLMILIAGLAALSVLVICAASDLAGGVSTFKELGEKAAGKGFGVFIQVVVALYTLGSCISYCVLLMDFWPDILRALSGESGQWWESRWFVIVIAGSLILLPLSLARDLSNFAWTSSAAVGCILMTVGILIWRGTDPTGWDSVEVFNMTSGTFAALPILSVASTMHYNGIRYYREIVEEHRNLRSMAIVTLSAFGICTVAYAASSAAGYAAFGVNTESDVLENFATDLGLVEGRVALAVRVAFGIVVICTYPLALHPLRAAIFTLLPPELACCRRTVQTSSLYIAVTVFLVIATCTIGWLVPKVSVVLDYKGALAGSCIVFIAPGVMYAALKLRKSSSSSFPSINSKSEPLLPPGEMEPVSIEPKEEEDPDSLHSAGCCASLGCGCAGELAFFCGGPDGLRGPTTTVCSGRWWSLLCRRVVCTGAGMLSTVFVLFGLGPMMIGGILKAAGALTS
jgi:solute carrier family 38 (sodium-coupled neutral amino acid transporter), member 2